MTVGLAETDHGRLNGDMRDTIPEARVVKEH